MKLCNFQGSKSNQHSNTHPQSLSPWFKFKSSRWRKRWVSQGNVDGVHDRLWGIALRIALRIDVPRLAAAKAKRDGAHSFIC